jgi:dihydrofolate reductase
VSRKVIFSAAMSLDGFIADEHDGYSWIQGDGDHSLDTLEKWDYPVFLSQIDTVLMGRRCYELGQHNDFKDQKVIVATHQDLKDPSVSFTSDALDCLRELQKQPGKDIFVFGGALLVQSLLKAQIIDELIIGIVPVILGKGIRLFDESLGVQLKLKKQTIDEGIVVLFYSQRHG